MNPQQIAAMLALEQFQVLVDTMRGMRAQLEADGYLPDEARRVVVTAMTGYRYDMEGES